MTYELINYRMKVHIDSIRNIIKPWKAGESGNKSAIEDFYITQIVLVIIQDSFYIIVNKAKHSKGEMNSITLDKYILLGLDSAVSLCPNGMSSSQSNKHAKIPRVTWKTMLQTPSDK
jgi:hypothetical protein